ncbi:hypothetical protein JYU34_007169 [Plutella xylostella]|uniref:Protein-L-isoaspartate O-methyltransferase domain-containing protein 1 n=1 Tax=Plutella xylostella TaxID=51655 RepID=A0ABQ7QPQ2_PLUXY|nr:hypothetical protein JYU34_007169 [Plutella xylostella]
MGGAVSSGRDNNELIDNLMGSKYIRSRSVEMVFRALDRADYMLPAERDRAYKDLAWRSGALHMSAPCIYSEVMEGLELKPGLSFLNIGSGTGYLSTLVGLIIGSGGISHGVEIHGMVVDYANKRLKEFSENSVSLDEFDFCEPKFFLGNGLCLAPLQSPYDRVYCGAGCPEQYQNYFKQLIKVGGILVMPLNENLLQVRRVSATEWTTRNLLNVSFATLRVPSDAEKGEHLRLDEQTPPKLQILSRAAIRAQMRRAVLSRQPELRAPPAPDTPAKKAVPRRICIPIEDDSDVDGLNALHDLDGPTGAQEMNALLSLVLSMGQNRVAGALRFDPSDDNSATSSSEEDDDDEEEEDDDDDDDGGDAPDGADAPDQRPQNRRNLIQTFENIEDMNRAIHRVINSVERPNVNGEAVEPSTRGRLSLTLEYNTPNSDDTTSQETVDLTADSPPPPRRKHKKRRSHSRALPEEVEIDIQKQKTETETAEPSTSSHSEEMELDAQASPGAEAGGAGAASSAAAPGKRQKLDSGLGEENSPSCSSARTDSKTDEDAASEPRSDGCYTDDVDEMSLNARRRLPKRGHCELEACSSSSESEGEAPPAAGFRHKRPARPPRSARPARPPGRDARRVRLSIVMKRSVKELPLPYALKRYVNLHRCFEF